MLEHIMVLIICSKVLWFINVSVINGYNFYFFSKIDGISTFCVI